MIDMVETVEAPTVEVETDLGRVLAVLIATGVVQFGLQTARESARTATERATASARRIAPLLEAPRPFLLVGGWTQFLSPGQEQRALDCAEEVLAPVEDLDGGVTPDVQSLEDLTEQLTTVLVGLLLRGRTDMLRVSASADELLRTVLQDRALLRHLLGSADAVLNQDVSGSPRAFLCVLVFALLIALYLLARFQGHYVEQDTAEMTSLIQAVLKFGSAIPDPSVPAVYPSGYGFQAISIYLIRLSGVPVQVFETRVWPFFLIADAFMAYIAFREMTADNRKGALAALFLLLQPDFLFTALRGSHEKVTYFLLLCCLFLLFRSYRYRRQVRRLARYVVLFYFVSFSILSINSTFGSSLIVALTGSFFLGGLLSFFFNDQAVQRRLSLIRLGYISGSSFLLLFLELFYFYHPSQGIFNQFQTAMDRLAGFALSFQASDNPYSYISLGWRNIYIYFILTSFTWLTLLVSSLSWIRRTWLVFFRNEWESMTDNLRLMWLLYAGLAIQVAVGIAADFSGVLGANLQLRLFPVFMFIAIPMSASAVVAFLDALGGWRFLRLGVKVGMGAALAFFAVCGAFKATNEPLLSDKWTFYSTGELQTIRWLDTNVPRVSVWADVDERIREVYIFFTQSPYAAQRFPTLDLPEQVPLVMLSAITRTRMAVLGVSLPDVNRMNEVYNNGSVQVYRQLPKNPLQP
ncbi:MAG: hypothetical protein M1296_01515 [Chloroflexi bacterium]|nr:hypothetical protein [Chloroflexota bacterium]